MMMKRVSEKMRMGMKPRQAIASALAERRLAQGGMVMPDKTKPRPNPINYPVGASLHDGGMVEEEEEEMSHGTRPIGELQEQADMDPASVANPSELAHALREMEYAMGGLVQAGPKEDQMLHGNQPEENMADATEEPMSAEPMKPSAEMMTEAAKEALRRKKAARRYS